MRSGFKWSIGSPPPMIETHSAAKLRLISLYLERYFKTVSPDPRSDKLQISLVDGFCGGGSFLQSGKLVPGSPIIMLDAVKNAERFLNERRIKKIQLDAHFYFVDTSKEALDFLRNQIRESGYEEELGSRIQIINSSFQDCYLNIAREIGDRARAGRSIFLLDQFGFNNVDFSHVRRIMQSLHRSEIIMTFAVDWLISYMSDHASFVKGVAPIEITEDQIRHYLNEKGPPGWRFAVQRLLIPHLHANTQSPFFTPFFLRSIESGRDLWLIHLSKHPTARNVMTSTHWDIGNASLHPGKAGLNMLGFDPHWEESLPLDFAFDANAEMLTEQTLAKDLPHAIEEFTQNGPITFEAFQSVIANETAARLDQIESSLAQLYTNKDIEILTPSGQLKRPDTKLKNTDRIQIPRQLIFPGIKF